MSGNRTPGAYTSKHSNISATEIINGKPGKLVIELRTIRSKSGMPQRELAARIGVWPSRISSWENGKTRPSDELLLRWAAILGYQLKISYSLDLAPLPNGSSLVHPT